jgi:transcriptional regulator with XRE-family HTH domain
VDERTADSAAAWQRVGEQLRAARQRRGLTIHDLAARTRIKDALLDAIEQGDMDKLPRGPFGRGFARAYALEVGLDPDELLAPFRSAPIVVPEIAPPDPEPRLTPATVAGRLAVSVLVIAAAIMLPRWTTSESAEPPEGPAIAQAVATTGVRSPDENPVAATSPQTQPQPLHPAGITFTLRAIEEVWIEATADGERVAYGLLPSGTERTIVADDSLAIRIGDAGAVEYTLNGTPGAPLGARGAVRDLLFTPDSVASPR